MWKLAGVLALVAPIGCGAPQSADRKSAQDIAVKTYGPLEMKLDAKAAHQAVILGTNVHDGSTVVPLPAAESRASVDAMFVHFGGNAPASGGLTPVSLVTAPNADGPCGALGERSCVQVGVMEQFAGGTGPQWRAGVWMAAVVAATALDKDLTDFTFSASSGGYIDGASASGLIAAGFVAAMTGAPIDASVAMTGTINPDGSIGPVGGIPEKFLAAIDKGKKHLGYPIGMRYAKSEANGALVDVVELARAHGAEAVEIADLHEAYHLLTGKTLPSPVPVAEADMALDAASEQALDAKYKMWQQHLAGVWAQILQLETAGKLPEQVAAVRTRAQDFAAQAEKLHQRHLAAPAYARILRAVAYADAAIRANEILTLVRGGDIDATMTKLVSGADTSARLRELFTKLGNNRPATLGGHLGLMGAFEAALESWVYDELAQRTAVSLATLARAQMPQGTKPTPETVDQLAQVIVPIELYSARATIGTDLADLELGYATTTSVSYQCSILNVRRMAAAFASASAAGLAYFDTLLLEPFAQSSHLSEDDARQRLELSEPTYLVTFEASKLAERESLPAEFKAAWGEQSLAWGLLSLASSELAYNGAAQLVTKYYTLDVQRDASGRVSTLSFDKAFVHMLESAERNARAAARAARIATGSIPVQAKLSYQLALVERDGELDDQIEALISFWQSSAMSQTAVMLARN